ncbi:hypothetical protein RV16_GL002506 [Enterococcus saccharolyticus]|nr:hypothetical protein RV16_GL002506 [Enterococcus saccharolyticus]
MTSWFGYLLTKKWLFSMLNEIDVDETVVEQLFIFLKKYEKKIEFSEKYKCLV